MNLPHIIIALFLCQIESELLSCHKFEVHGPLTSLPIILTRLTLSIQNLDLSYFVPFLMALSYFIL